MKYKNRHVLVASGPKMVILSKISLEELERD